MQRARSGPHRFILAGLLTPDTDAKAACFASSIPSYVTPHQQPTLPAEAEWPVALD
jgi:hypothetical protein